MTLKENTKPHNNIPNSIPYVPADPDSDPSLSNSSSSDSCELSESEYYRQMRRVKKDKTMSK